MLRQSSLLFVSKVAGFGIRILLPVFLVRILPKADIGVYNQFFMVELLIQAIIQLGINQSQYYFIPRDPRNSGGYFLNCVSLNFIFFLAGYGLLAVFRGDLAASLGLPVLERFFWHLAAYTLLMLFNISSQIYMTVLEDFKAAAVYDISRQLLASIVTLAAAYWTRSLDVIIGVLVASRLVTLAAGILYIHLKTRGFRSERYFFDIWRQMRYGVVMGAAGLVGAFGLKMHELMVSKFYDIETYAVYAQGLKQIPVIMFMAQSLAPVALVRIARQEKENDWAAIRATWNDVLGTMYGVAIPVTLLAVIFAEPLILLMYTEEYAGAVSIFRISSLAMLYHVLNPTLVLRALDRNDVTLKVTFGVLVVMPAALYMGMRLFGLEGIVAAYAVVTIGGRLVIHSILNRLTPVRLPAVAPLKSVGAFYATMFRKGVALVSRRAS